ncbi:hypothetical protein LINPERHAP1_LOCUS34793 [Linum perenne]
MTLSYICPSISTRIVSQSPSASLEKFDILTNLMCAHYDPKATVESVNNDPNLKGICDASEKPEECIDFLGNSPNANPVYAIKADVMKLRTFLNEASQQASTAPPPEVKSNFDTCAHNFNEAVNRLDDVMVSCIICSQANEKCPAEEATKINIALNSALADLGLCDKALDATTATVKKSLKECNLGATESINKILEVAKKLN